VQNGWLNTKTTLVELKLREKAVHLWRRKHQDLAQILVKVTPVDVNSANHQHPSLDEESVDVAEVRERSGKTWPVVDVAVRLRNESN